MVRCLARTLERHRGPPLSIDFKKHDATKACVAHGVEFTHVRDKEACADSPFDPSGRSDKFHLNLKTGLWHDKKVESGGTLAAFLQRMHDETYGPALSKVHLKTLAQRRRLPLAAFKRWRGVVGYDETHSAYTLLCHNPASGEPCNLYWWTLDGKQWNTPGCPVGLFGFARTTDDESRVRFLCEGAWDAVALDHLLSALDEPGVVLGVAGAGVFKPTWARSFAGCDVRVLYDHDSSGKHGDAKVARQLKRTARSLQFLHWTVADEDDSAIPRGADMNDAVAAAVAARQENPDALRECWEQLCSGLQDHARTDDDADSDGASGTLDILKREWVYAYETKRFVYVGSVDAAAGADHGVSRAFYELDKESFSDRYAEHFPGGNQRMAAQQMLTAPDCVKVARPAYLPGQPQRTTERVKGVELPVVNLWLPSELPVQRGDVRRYLDHAAFVIPDNHARQTVLDWLAFLLRQPERKPNWAVLVGGEQGLGKDLLVWPVAQALGRSNYCTPTPDDLENGYTDWLKHTKLVIVDTLRFFGRRDLMDRMKPWIASPPERLRINGKYAVPYDIANLVAFFFMANREDALALDPDDRRFFVYWSTAKKKSGSYYGGLWDWVREHAGAVAHYFLHEHEVSEAFDPLAPPPMTDAKRHMIRANESELLQEIRQAFEEERPPFSRELVLNREVKRYLMAHTPLRHPSEHAIAAALKQLGAVKMKAQLRLQTKANTTERPHAWALRNAEHYAAMSEKALTEEYERQRTLGRYRRPTLRVVVRRKGRA